jgi:hypothetical protein
MHVYVQHVIGGKQVNYEGTLHVLEACRAHGVPKLVFASSPSTRFDGTDVDGLTEDQMPSLPQKAYLQVIKCRASHIWHTNRFKKTSSFIIQVTHGLPLVWRCFARGWCMTRIPQNLVFRRRSSSHLPFFPFFSLLPVSAFSFPRITPKRKQRQSLQSERLAVTSS